MPPQAAAGVFLLIGIFGLNVLLAVASLVAMLLKRVEDTTSSRRWCRRVGAACVLGNGAMLLIALLCDGMLLIVLLIPALISASFGGLANWIGQPTPEEELGLLP